MIIVRYGYDGTKLVVARNSSRAQLSRWAKAREAAGWNVSKSSPYEFEATHGGVACGYVYRIRPDDWPLHNGEPE